jgi:hypothetical protein
LAVSGEATEGINGRSYALESSKISMLPAIDVFVPTGRADVFATDGAVVSLITVLDGVTMALRVQVHIETVLRRRKEITGHSVVAVPLP